MKQRSRFDLVLFVGHRFGRTWFLMDVTVVTVDWILTALASQQEVGPETG